MCQFFDPAVTEQCSEDDAEEVKEKIRSNFCDYFKPGYGTFDPASAEAENLAKNALDSLFGEGDGDEKDKSGTGGSSDAEDLFR